jgi:hypothetical protein
MFAMAKYGTTSALRSEFSRLDSFQDEIERRLARPRVSYSDSLVLAVRRYCVPDNRFQLNALCVHVAKASDSRLSESVKHVCADLPKSELPIVRWDAHTTWFDIPHRWEGIPMDTSNGVTTYKFYGWPSRIYLDSGAQRLLIQKVRKSVLPPE